MTAIYGILDTETNQFVCFENKKLAWAKPAYAKAAWNLHSGALDYFNPSHKFNEQTRYKVVELTEAYYRLEGLEK